ncbi:MAG: hypothetical protein LBL99_01040 [Holosporaceae bacterium]|jgi:hypothetical protein|nr:hypothetical protein [Holosporaceae bacterium]
MKNKHSLQVLVICFASLAFIENSPAVCGSSSIVWKVGNTANTNRARAASLRYAAGLPTKIVEDHASTKKKTKPIDFGNAIWRLDHPDNTAETTLENPLTARRKDLKVIRLPDGRRFILKEMTATQIRGDVRRNKLMQGKNKFMQESHLLYLHLVGAEYVKRHDSESVFKISDPLLLETLPSGRRSLGRKEDPIALTAQPFAEGINGKEILRFEWGDHIAHEEFVDRMGRALRYLREHEIEHNDFTSGNWFYNPQNTMISIIDWDDPDASGDRGAFASFFSELVFHAMKNRFSDGAASLITKFLDAYTQGKTEKISKDEGEVAELCFLPKIFGTGFVEPDPSYMTNVEKAIGEITAEELQGTNGDIFRSWNEVLRARDAQNIQAFGESIIARFSEYFSF